MRSLKSAGVKQIKNKILLKIIKYFVLIILPFLFIKCAPLSSMPTLKRDTTVVINDTTDFVELKDGSFIRGTISKYSLGEILAKHGGSAVIEGKKFWYPDVIAAQYQKKYYRKDVHNGFDERIVKGKINVYKYLEITETEYQTSIFDWYFLQKADKAPIVEFSVKILEKMIADSQPAMEELKKYKALKKQDKKIKGDQYLNNIISVYNNR